MKTSAAKQKGKRLDWSVRTGVDQTKIRVEPATETKNRAQFSRQTHKPRHNPLRGLDGAQNGRNMEEKVFHLGNVGSILLKVVSDAKV